MKLIQAINEEDIVRVQEFTTVLDQREVPDAVGCILEIIGDIGMAVHCTLYYMVLTELSQAPMQT